MHDFGRFLAANRDEGGLFRALQAPFFCGAPSLRGMPPTTIKPDTWYTVTPTEVAAAAYKAFYLSKDKRLTTNRIKM